MLRMRTKCAWKTEEIDVITGNVSAVKGKLFRIRLLKVVASLCPNVS